MKLSECERTWYVVESAAMRGLLVCQAAAGMEAAAAARKSRRRIPSIISSDGRRGAAGGVLLSNLRQSRNQSAGLRGLPRADLPGVRHAGGAHRRVGDRLTPGRRKRLPVADESACPTKSLLTLQVVEQACRRNLGSRRKGRLALELDVLQLQNAGRDIGILDRA